METTKEINQMINVNNYKLGKAKFIKASSLKTLRHQVTCMAKVITGYNSETGNPVWEEKTVCGWASNVIATGRSVQFSLVDDRGNHRGFVSSIGAETEVYVQHSNMFPFDLVEEFQANGENVKHFDWAYGTEWLNVKYTTVWGDSKIDPRTKAGKNAIAGLEVPTYEEYIATI
tara:strand:+ start:4508 stop:5026 length:519 start_codon:yes stop_codon:yes gene_type:complete